MTQSKLTALASGAHPAGSFRPRLVVMGRFLASLVGLSISAAALAAEQPTPGSLGEQPSQPTTQVPSQAELDRADSEPAQWLTRNKGYLGYRFSRLSQISISNVHDLKRICSFPLGERGSFQNGPVVYQGVLYTTSALATIAIDGATCEKRWEHRYTPDHLVTPNNKGAAIAGGRVIRGTPDGHLIALDAKTGALLWDRQIMDPRKGEYATAAPLVWNDMVFMGKAGGDLGIRGEMMAFRTVDAQKIWGFYTIPSPGQPGSETWQNPASIEHGGGSLWTTFTLDAVAGLLLIPVGNPGPDFANEARPGTNLFTNSLVALDARTGQLKWWHQLVAPDDRDWDTAVAAAFDVPDGSKLAAVAGKDGVIHVVDRITGKLRSAAPLVTRYLNTTGTVPGGSGIRLCPIAAVQWNGPAYSPDTHLIYMNGIDWCAQAIKGPTPVFQEGHEYLGWANYYGTRDPLDEASVDPTNGNVVWRYKASSLPLGAVTATGGGLVITGEIDGDLVALDAGTGAELHKTHLGGAIGGGIVTYEAGGRQLIAAAVGDNNFTYKTKGDNTIVVLGLP
jgi:alcohol dehydrogenase (cytochrome c)